MDKVKQPRGKSEGLKFEIIIFGVIIAITIILTPIWSLSSGNVRGVLATVWLLGLVALVFFVYMFLSESWKHPKWYVKLYTAACFIWEIFCAFVLLATFGTGGAYGFGPAWSLFGSREPFIVILQTFVLAFPPLIPIWYWCYKEYEQEKKKSLEELEGLLTYGAITQEEYEEKEKKKKLLGKTQNPTRKR